MAIVSGASSGIGAAIATELSRQGAHVVINYPINSARSAAKETLHKLTGPSKSIMVEADLSTFEGPKHLVDMAAAEFGKIDILVNNAGINAHCPITGVSDDAVKEQWDAVVNVNGRGTWLLTRAALTKLSSDDSRIINIGSSTSRDPDPNMSIYAGTKGMVETFTRCWALELPRKYGCTVNTVAPGPTSTVQMLAAPQAFRDLISQKQESVPVAARMATPDEVAWTVAMLCHPSARWLNGLWIPVTGGGVLL